MVVLAHTSSGEVFEYMQEGHSLVHYIEEVVPEHIVWRLPTSKVCHEIFCRFYSETRSLPVKLSEMIDLGYRHGKCCD